MRKRLTSAPLVPSRPPVAIAAAWFAATVGIAGLIVTHPAASSWHSFTSYALIGPLRENRASVTSGELPSELVLESLLDAPPVAPAMVEPSEPILVTRQPAAPPPPAPTAEADETPAETPAQPAPTRPLPVAPSPVAVAQALTGPGSDTLKTPTRTTTTSTKGVGPLTPSRGGTRWVTPPDSSPSGTKTRESDTGSSGGVVLGSGPDAKAETNGADEQDNPTKNDTNAAKPDKEPKPSKN